MRTKDNYNVDVEHMSSPDGCHPDCPACREEAEHTPDIWLQDDNEKSGTANCGCRLIAEFSGAKDSGNIPAPAFNFCPLHRAAGALLEAAKYTLGNLDAAFKDKLISAPLNFQVQLTESRKLLSEAIAQARPPKAKKPDWFA